MSQNRVDVAVVGAGYVGLTLALHMASRGLTVLAIDNDAKKVADLQNGETPIFETDIRETLRQCIQSGTLRCTLQSTEGIPAWVLAISYFPGDTTHYLRVLDTIHGRDGAPPLIMIRGTVPVGYIRTYLLPALEKRLSGALDEAFYLVSAPERSLSGVALEELADLPQIVGGTPKSTEKAVQLFEKAGINCIVLPNWEAGELAKTFTNFARLVQFNLANFLGVLCHQYDISEENMVKAITAGYPRLNFLSVPGPGVGGFCLPKDSLVLHDGLCELEERHIVLPAIRDYPAQQNQLNGSVIEYHTRRVAALTKTAHRILAMGVAFKGVPRTDDTRDSTGVTIAKGLLRQGRQVHVFDRTVDTKKIVALELPVADTPLDLAGYDAVLLLNNDPEYVTILRQHLPSHLTANVVLYDPWHLVVTGKESVFQAAFPWQAITRHLG